MLLTLLHSYKKTLAVASIAVLWQITSYSVNEPLIFPDLLSVLKALYNLFWISKFYSSLWSSISTLFLSYICGLSLTLTIVLIAMHNRIFRNFFTQYCIYFNPLPSFVLLPFISLFFGLGYTTILVVIITNVVWQSGFQMLKIFDTVHEQWHTHAKNLRWGRLKSLYYIYIPASLNNLLGLANTAWSNSWRILISMEVVFGSIGGHFGLGSYITDSRTQLNTDRMYATLIVIIITGIIINWLLHKLSRRYEI